MLLGIRGISDAGPGGDLDVTEIGSTLQRTLQPEPVLEANPRRQRESQAETLLEDLGIVENWI
jgi:hypothetical protein